MTTAEGSGNPQADRWNGVAGRNWVASQEMLEALFAPLRARLVEVARAAAPAHVLDIGCGTGGTTLALARALAGNGRCTGIDISAPMLDAARAGAAEAGVEASFVLADAQAHDFPPAEYDLLLSRFGVMFFADPVAAFGNLRRAASGGARMLLHAWRGAAENPFMTAAERAAAPHLPDLPSRQPDGPGQFAFGDEIRVRRILSDSGWTNIEIRPLDLPLSMPEMHLDTYLNRLGPVGAMLQDADPELRRRVLAAVRPAFAPFVADGQVRFTAACWEIEARNPGA